MTDSVKPRRRWHIAVFLAPALLVYTMIMLVPLAQTLWLGLENVRDGEVRFVGLENFQLLFGDPRWSAGFWNAFANNFYFFLFHMLVQNPIGIALAALLSVPRLKGVALYRTALFLPTILSFVIVGFIWKLLLSPLWGVAPNLLGAIGLRSLFAPWLGQEAYALTAVSLVSVWQFVGIPMMLIYAALITIPDEITEAAECDGIVGFKQFFKIKLPLILPTIGLVAILTFVANFNAFDIVYSMQGALAGPNGSTDILGTFLYRTFFGFQLQSGDRHMGAAVATAMFLIILIGVSLYLFVVQRRLRRYQM
ncbi:MULTISPECIES: carbohydrate ABC transporter permease [unclassified Aureimonas]|uniref:carbohydrate ABC transporter permease n=1 Tax=unclassified Aureimonas TaxID=2615206 RepID=UPI0006FC27AD|nr:MULTISPECIES: sugar ABC transporter permease [unclassified Aureimonas]KQT55244.1 ABC transporter permease [Aureimonas sp. Leaf427]KQT71036.1 ABC transporter permease [Aureimonas sp. Leaf460]